MDKFIEQVKRELSMIFPANHLTHLQLDADLGALIQKRTGQAPSGDGSELTNAGLRTEFELKWLNNLTRSKQQMDQRDE
jgi:hypothetical protein